jgi:hypothetical protein
MNKITLLDQKLSQISAVLTGNASDKCNLSQRILLEKILAAFTAALHVPPGHPETMKSRANYPPFLTLQRHFWRTNSFSPMRAIGQMIFQLNPPD